MINNFISGGQVFLHKVRMFRQVIITTIFVSLIIGFCLTWTVSVKNTKLDLDGAVTYAKAKLALKVHPALSAISIGKSKANVDAYSEGKLWKKRMLASSVISSNRFKSAWDQAIVFTYSLIIKSLTFGFLVGGLVFLLWSKFGRDLKTEKKNKGTAVILTEKEVKAGLNSIGKISDFYVGSMPLVKDMETRHFLVTGLTGSGKTNLIHNLLLQVEKKKQAAIVIDQTGEMIAKYYNPKRGDIIFNPFDARGSDWDFWQDCSNEIELERFSKILIGFNRKASSAHSDPFWENAAMSIFNGCVESLRRKNASMEEIVQLVCNADINDLKKILRGTEAGRFLGKNPTQTSESILSVLTANAKPLTYLAYGEDNMDADVKRFSIKEYFEKVKSNSDSWLFLATKPSNRSLTLPLIACMSELALSQLMEIGINKDRRVWVVMDELASLGKLPALSSLMSEGRKYGACVIAAMQSLNQLYEAYGQYSGSSIFGQFGTSFFFRNNEPAIAKMISSICGSEVITRQQKNTSFGANEFRDGVSYSEQIQKKALVEIEDLASLAVGECYTILPEPAARLSKIQTKEITVQDKHEAFIPKQEIQILNEEEVTNDQEIVDVFTTDEEETSNSEATSSHIKKDNNKKKQMILEI